MILIANHSRRESFEKEELIYIPVNDQFVSAAPSECIWNGPEWMLTLQALEPRYSKALGSDGSNDRLNRLADFFRTTLKITPLSAEQIISELREIKAELAAARFRGTWSGGSRRQTGGAESCA